MWGLLRTEGSSPKEGIGEVVIGEVAALLDGSWMGTRPLDTMTRRAERYAVGVSSPSTLNCGDDGLDGIVRRDVLPQPDDAPTARLERNGRPQVARSIRGDLFPPIGSIGCGLCAVKRASVPEAAIEKHGDFGSGERDIRTYRLRILGAYRIVDAKAESTPMESRAQRKLDRRVAPSVGAHDATSRLGHADPRL